MNIVSHSISFDGCRPTLTADSVDLCISALTIILTLTLTLTLLIICP